jgi:hypothetical protein
MSTDLEKFIQRNRDDFDNAHPSEKVWERIRANFSAQKKARLYFLQQIYKWSVAAALLIAIFASIYFLIDKKYGHEDSSFTTTPTKQPEETSSINPEYAVEFNKVYQSVISRQKELENAAVSEPGLYQQFQQDLAVLDSSYRLLKNQVSQSINRDVITKAMIQNLQLQAELLNRQLQIINQFKNTKKESHETSI